jgi:hypothetical protein
MAGASKALWFGYLEAGARSSAVVRDDRLDTGDPRTIYLFNKEKGRILEYRREIVEAKLRELTVEEAGLMPALKRSFDEVRSGFVPRAKARSAIRTQLRVKPSEPEEPDFDDAVAFPMMDDDIREQAEERPY